MNMKRIWGSFRYRNGFTLLEVIISLVLVAILGTMLSALLSRNLANSIAPITLMRDEFTSNQIMEQLVAEYRKRLAVENFNLDSFRLYVVDNYGPYLVTSPQYIGFSGAAGSSRTESAPTNALILKVVIRNNSQTITTLFTR